MDHARIDTCLFDLDGTLIDSIELIRRSYVHTLREHLGIEPEREAWLDGLGRPLVWQFSQLVSDEREIEAMVATYRRYNFEHHDAMVAPYPGAVDAIRELHESGAKLGLVTSKARHGALRGLSRCGLDALWFGAIVGADDVELHKPDPAPVRRALELLGARPEKAVMVGDSPHDLASGRGAGTLTAAVAWGPFPRERLLATEPDLWLESPREIAGLLRNGSGRPA